MLFITVDVKAQLGVSITRYDVANMLEAREGKSLVLPDGGTVMSGYFFDLNENLYKMLVNRFDSTGALIWSRSYGSLTKDYIFEDIAYSPDSTLLLLSTGGLGLQSTISIAKIDLAGNFLWARWFSIPNKTLGNGVAVAPNGDIGISGYNSYQTLGGYDMLAFKIAPNGNVAWARSIGSYLDESGETVAYSQSDSTWIFAGTAFNAQNNSRDAYMVKLDSVGNMVWGNMYGMTANEKPLKVIETAASDYLVAGSREQGNTAPILFKVDGNGGYLWGKSYHSATYGGFTDVLELSTSDLMIVGNQDHTVPFLPPTGAALLMKTDANGDTIWSNVVAPGGSAGFNTIDELPNGSVMTTGTFYASGNTSIIHAILDSVGTSACDVFAQPMTVGAPSLLQTTRDSITTAFYSTGTEVLISSPVVLDTSGYCAACMGSSSYAFGITCAGDSDGVVGVSAAGGLPPHSYVWNTGATTMEVDSLPPGTYTVTITDAIDCVITETLIIETVDTLGLSLLESDPLCAGDTLGYISAGTYGGTTPYSYVWSDGSTAPTNTNLTEGMYIVTVTDTNFCTATDTGYITNPPPYVISTGASADANSQGIGMAWINVTGGTPGSNYQYYWNDPAQQVGDTATDLMAGIYVVTVVNQFGCTFPDTLIVGAVGVESLEGVLDLAIYPNPTNDIVNVMLNDLNVDDLQLEVLSADGRLIQRGVPLNYGQSRSIDLSQHATGVYIFRFFWEGGSFSKRIILN